MARGNQRDLAREKAAKKKQGGKSKYNSLFKVPGRPPLTPLFIASKEQDGNKGLTHTQRQERDAEVSSNSLLRFS